MTELIDPRTRTWALVAIGVGIALFVALEILEEPGISMLDIALELVGIVPVVLTSVGLAVLFRMAVRQREEHLTLIRDLEVARMQGQRWRSEARTLLNELGDAIDAQFSRWNLTEAEREVALLLLKGRARIPQTAFAHVADLRRHRRLPARRGVAHHRSAMALPPPRIPEGEHRLGPDDQRNGLRARDRVDDCVLARVRLDPSL